MFRLLCNICPSVLQKTEVHHMPAVATWYSSVKQPLQKPQAALGATIQVPTLDGKVDYEIPEGTQTGREFILREKGIPEVGNTRRRGNERFTVVVETPTRLTKEQKDLLRQLDGSVDQSPKRKKFLNNLKDFFG